MRRNIRKFGMLAMACATVASPSVFATANAQAAVAPASAGADAAVPAGFRLIPAGTYTPLPVGDPALTETRSFETLEPGVTLTHIVRGTTPLVQATSTRRWKAPSSSTSSPSTRRRPRVTCRLCAAST